MNHQDFPLLQEDLVYLDNAATTQKPQVVIDAVSGFYLKNNANVHRGIYSLSEKATLAYENARQIVADFINAEKKEVIFTKGTTEGLNLLARTIDLQKGDEIVLTVMEHHANLVPWQQIAKEKKLILKFIPLNDYKLDLEKAREMITSKTKVVSVTHVSNVLGAINPVQELSRLAHFHGALMIIDAAQSLPHMKIDAQELGCDFLVFSGHKMLGPTGIGVLYGRQKLLEEMHPYQFGGEMVLDVDFEKAEWNELPWKWEAGTPNIAGAIGLGRAIQYLEKIGMDKVEEYLQELNAYALEKLSAVEGLKIIGPIKNRAPIFSFVLKDIHPHDVCQILDQEKIAVRGGHHCAMPLMKFLRIKGTTRASFYLYNTKEEVDRLVKGIRKVLEVLG